MVIAEQLVPISLDPSILPTAAGPEPALDVPRRRRLKLWEIEQACHCSVVGTCLTPGMVRGVLRRAGMVVEPGTRDHEIHGRLVAEAGKGGPVARLLHKALDQAYAGIVRRVGAAADDPRALSTLWDELCAGGEVAAAYWAFLSHAATPHELRVRVFGEVHMLSHFVGGHNRSDAKALWLAEERLRQAAERLARSRRQARETAAAKDRRIEELEAGLRAATEQAAKSTRFRETAGPGHDPAGARARQARRLLATRARLQAAEAENARLRRLLDALTDRAVVAPRPPTASPESPRPEVAPALPAAGGRDGCRLLYVGGRCAMVPHLRRHAAARNLDLLHHDGGEETTLHALEGLVGQADAVFCPVDCVSHQACLAAKRLCRRLEKPFVPLRTGGGACFLRAVDAWRRGSAAEGAGTGSSGLN